MTPETRGPPRWRRTIVPAFASLALHAVLLAAAIVATVAVTGPTEPQRGDAVTPSVALDLAPPRPRAEPSGAPRAPRERQAGERAGDASPAPSETRAARRAVEAARAAASARAGVPGASLSTPGRVAAESGPSERAARGPSPPDAVDAERPRSPPPIRFAGVTQRPATRVAFVVDASGAMASSWPIVAGELADTVDRLRPTQFATVVLFGPSDPAGEPLSPPLATDDRGYFRATRGNAVALRAWLETIIPGGRSRPLVGLEAALARDPETLFLLSRSIRRTGVGAAWGVGRERTLERLERLNPLDGETGRRPTSIATVQFIEPDPTGLMEAIAAAHGTGPEASSVITLEELGLPPREPPGPALDPEDARALEIAGAALHAPGAVSAADHAVLGLATEGERRRARRDADRALTALQRASPPGPSADPRLALLRGRAAVLLADLLADPADPGTPADLGTPADPGPIRDDLIGTARANLEPLEPIEPAHAAQRELALALAESLGGDPDAAIRRLETLRRDAAALELDGLTVARAALLQLRIAGDPAGVEPSAGAGVLAEAGGDYLRLLGAEARTRAALQTEPPDPTAFAPLLELLGDPELGDAARGRLRLAAARAPALAAGHPDHRVTLALADRLEREQPRRAAELLRALADRAAPSVARPALARAARLLGPIDAAEASDIWLRLALEHADDDAARRALERTPEADRGGRLAVLLRSRPGHPDADAWRLERAAALRGRERLAMLDAIGPSSPLRGRADELAYATLRAMLDRRPSDALRSRAARLAEALGRPEARDLELDLAESLIETDPRGARDRLKSLLDAHPDRDRVTIALARAELAMGREARAHDALIPLVERLTRPAPDTERGWSRLAEALALLSRDPGQRGAVRAHVVRLRWADPDLGGGRAARELRSLVGDGPPEP